uniref:7TM GPCR serpentine receptor class x (Srx) domain-containing protein n=1 Tax=Strongyloides stercoralis TaxID=6248 RepID=A0AAF5I203_STRER
MLVCNIFTTTFVISLNRFVCVKFPTKYKILFSYDRVKIIIIIIFCISLFFEFICAFYKSQFFYDEASKTVYSLHHATGFNFWIRILFNITMILMVFISLIFNIIDAYHLTNVKILENSKKMKTYWFPIYTFFLFITSTLIEICFILRFISNIANNSKLCIVSFNLLYFIRDVSVFGDFYFFLLFNTDIRREIRTYCKKIFLKKKNHTTVILFQ